MYKPGYRTSEFWFTLVSFIFSGLFLLGVIGDPSQKEELISNVTHAVESCILIGGQLMILYKYLKSRSTVKQAYLNSQTPSESVSESEVIEEVKNERVVKPKSKPRSNKAGNRKTNSKNKRKPSGSKKSSSS